MMVQQGVVSERTWKISQSLFAETVIRTKTNWLLKATVRRNAYDDQSWGKVWAWMNGRGWTEVAHRQIEELPDLKKHTYHAEDGRWENDAFNSCALMMLVADAMFGGLS